MSKERRIGNDRDPGDDEAFVGIHDPDGDVPVTTTVLDVLGEVPGLDVTAMAPLSESINTHALNLLFHPGCEDVTVTFTHAGHEITVQSDGLVKVHPPNPAPEG